MCNEPAGFVTEVCNEVCNECPPRLCYRPLEKITASFVSSEDLGGIASLVLPRAHLGCKWQQKGMNRGCELGDRFFSTGKTPRVSQEHKNSLCFTATVTQDRQLFPPRRTDCSQEASSKFQAQQRHPPPQRPASPSVLRQAAPTPPPQHHGCYRHSSTRTSAGLLYKALSIENSKPRPRWARNT